MRLASPRKPGNRTARVELYGKTMLTYLRILWHTLAASYRAARDGDDLGAELAEDGPGLAKCEPADPNHDDNVCGPHFGVLTCTCQSPLAHPVLWRDPGCPVHSRGVVVN